MAQSYRPCRRSCRDLTLSLCKPVLISSSHQRGKSEAKRRKDEIRLPVYPETIIDPICTLTHLASGSS